MKPVALLSIGVALSVSGVGCGGDSLPSKSGLNEPIRVTGGQFFAGKVPQGGNDGPKVSTILSRNNTFPQGDMEKKLTGDLGPGATAIALGFNDIGTGYWVVPAGEPDPQTTDNELTWTAPFTVASDAPVGKHALKLVAINAAGTYGPQNELPIEITPLIPTGHVVVTLAWDSQADLDIHIVAPSGKELYPKVVNTGAILDGGTVGPGSGLLDRDSNAGCVPDGVRRENVVWQDVPEPGIYTARVDMFDACGAAAANFVFDIRLDGNIIYESKGRLIAMDADGGGPGSGLFITNFRF